MYLGVRSLKAGQKLLFFRKRRDLMVRGWRLIFLSVMLGIGAISLNRFAEPIAYQFFPPSPTVTLTPTVTQTPTISLTPTITVTPSITWTPAISPTPSLPDEILTQITSVVTPSGNTIFSAVVFDQEVDEFYQAVEPQIEFENPVGKLYGSFTFDQMALGAQWTALWYRVNDWELVCYETFPWEASTGGYGYTECEPESDTWVPGEYETQIFIGSEWISSGRFTVIGDPPEPTISATASRTATTSATATATATDTATAGPSPTFTPSQTPTVTVTRTPSNTPTITRTLRPTWTQIPTLTPRATFTRWPTATNPPP
jgi:type VI secretion system secreted protein VgrG